MGKGMCSRVLAELSNVAVMMHGRRGNVVQIDVMRESDGRSDKRHVAEPVPLLVSPAVRLATRGDRYASQIAGVG